jgi:hypothetical protein
VEPDVITKSDMMAVLVAASPGFAAEWEAFRREWADQINDLPLYPVLGDFARHVVALLERNDPEALTRVFDAIESLHVNGDHYVREAATIGLLENLQNTNLHPTTGPDQLRPFLQSESLRWWDRLDSFWRGNHRALSEDLPHDSDPVARAVRREALVTKALDTIAAERGHFDRSFALAEDLIRAFGEAQLPERIYAAIPRERPWQDVADLFAILIWSTRDNGASIMSTMEQWLRSADDVRRVQVALHLDVDPFREAGTMEQVLADVASKFPEVADRCRDLIDERRCLPGKGAGATLGPTPAPAGAAECSPRRKPLGMERS